MHFPRDRGVTCGSVPAACCLGGRRRSGAVRHREEHHGREMPARKGQANRSVRKREQVLLRNSCTGDDHAQTCQHPGASGRRVWMRSRSAVRLQRSGVWPRLLRTGSQHRRGRGWRQPRRWGGRRRRCGILSTARPLGPRGSDSRILPRDRRRAYPSRGARLSRNLLRSADTARDSVPRSVRAAASASCAPPPTSATCSQIRSAAASPPGGAPLTRQLMSTNEGSDSPNYPPLHIPHRQPARTSRVGSGGLFPPTKCARQNVFRKTWAPRRRPFCTRARLQRRNCHAPGERGFACRPKRLALTQPLFGWQKNWPIAPVGRSA
jgi:hypothetical protein